MNRLFVIVIVLAQMAMAKSLDKILDLKKDQIYRGELQLGKFKKPLSLRWTLFKDGGLVVLLKCNGFPYQFILYPDFQRDTFRLDLFKEVIQTQSSEGIDPTPPYFALTFKKFDIHNEQASLRVRASDKLKWIEQP
ncbi:hypothetical protein [Helicobacter cynogastricus]|uniref:hypothetical protein n=1 Tax=Helicobacter cynogastricus TaxID=329937 RepID=UPI000CF1A25A|nr:hypothetical protein [Helicobacter cynogastricus]